MSHVNKSKAYSTLCFEVLGQIKVVKLSLKLFVDEFHEVSLRKLYGDVSYHKSCLLLYFFIAIQNALKVNLVIRRAN